MTKFAVLRRVDERFINTSCPAQSVSVEEGGYCDLRYIIGTDILPSVTVNKEDRRCRLHTLYGASCLCRLSTLVILQFICQCGTWGNTHPCVGDSVFGPLTSIGTWVAAPSLCRYLSLFLHLCAYPLLSIGGFGEIFNLCGVRLRAYRPPGWTRRGTVCLGGGVAHLPLHGAGLWRSAALSLVPCSCMTGPVAIPAPSA